MALHISRRQYLGMMAAAPAGFMAAGPAMAAGGAADRERRMKW